MSDNGITVFDMDDLAQEVAELEAKIERMQNAEVTPEMVLEGLEVLEASGRLAEGSLSSDGLLVSEVFRAMFARMREALK